MTEMEKSHRPWNGETGAISKEMLATASAPVEDFELDDAVRDRRFEVVRGLGTVTAAEGLKILISAVDAFVGRTRQHDDITALVIRPLRKSVAIPERNAIQFRNAQPPANRTDAVSLQNRSFPQCHEKSCRAIGSSFRVSDITGQSLPDLRWWRGESVKAALDHSAQ
jgi:hypothetical protein